ncbi:hypothetical protein QUA81_00425 [Microcoleus sp. F6_B4]
MGNREGLPLLPRNEEWNAVGRAGPRNPVSSQNLWLWHGAWGMGHGAWGMGHGAYLTTLDNR